MVVVTSVVIVINIVVAVAVVVVVVIPRIRLFISTKLSLRLSWRHQRFNFF